MSNLLASCSETAARLSRMQITCLPTLVIAGGPETLQSRQVLFAMSLNHRIWIGARTCSKMNVLKSRELVWPCFCPSKLICCWSNRLLRSLEPGEHPEWLFPSSGELKGKRRSLTGWSDEGAEAEMGLGEEKQNRLAQSFQEDSELLRGVLEPAKRLKEGDIGED